MIFTGEPENSMNTPLIIFDTDMDTDCDDAGALAILYEYVKRQKAELLGHMVIWKL